ncbi:hypothetical protein C8F01DRAFT_20660 [Mycena amicta]|nr:hypothetical protein C8F01DRAFT_20660 [Mycena amicta]
MGSLTSTVGHTSRGPPRPEEVVFQHSSPPKGSFRRLSSSKSSNRPSVVDIFAPLDSATSFFGQLDVPSIPSSPVASSHALDAAIELAAQRRDHNKTPTTSHSRNASFSSQSVLSSKRSSSSKSSISDVETSFTTTSSSSSVSRNIECVSETTTGTGDPFGVHSKTYYTPQTMIPTTPPNGTSRHVRRASKEESIIFSLQAQLAMQNELRGQYEADLRARDELVAVLRKKLEEAEEEDAKKRKFLKAWKRKVLELEKTCRMLDEGGRNLAPRKHGAQCYG